jgi:hypothetical protein
MTHVIAVEFHGARTTVELSDPELAGAVEAAMPLGAALVEPAAGPPRYGLQRGGDRYTVVDASGEPQAFAHLQQAVDVLGSHLVLYLMSHTPDLLWVHASAVARDDRAIVLPGRMGIGKSTLMMALLRAGAEFYSDDYLPVDAGGRAHPYLAEPNWVDPETGRHPPQDLRGMGVRLGETPVPIGLVAHVWREPEGTLQLRDGTEGEGLLALIDNALGARTNPALAMTAARAAVSGARVVAGPRGHDADEAAAALLARL